MTAIIVMAVVAVAYLALKVKTGTFGVGWYTMFENHRRIAREDGDGLLSDLEREVSILEARAKEFRAQEAEQDDVNSQFAAACHGKAHAYDSAATRLRNLSFSRVSLRPRCGSVSEDG